MSLFESHLMLSKISIYWIWNHSIWLLSQWLRRDDVCKIETFPHLTTVWNEWYEKTKQTKWHCLLWLVLIIEWLHAIQIHLLLIKSILSKLKNKHVWWNATVNQPRFHHLQTRIDCIQKQCFRSNHFSSPIWPMCSSF